MVAIKGKVLNHLTFYIKEENVERLQLYKINIDYIKYLYNFDKKIQYNTDENDAYTREDHM